MTTEGASRARPVCTGSLAMLLALLLAGTASAEAAPRLNVLLVVVDDLNCDLACYGSAGVSTPNIDALARRGVRFANAYAQGVACNPSRASLLTGRFPIATRVLDNQTHYRDALPRAVTLARHFRDGGYRTGLAGKLAHRGYDDREAWEHHGAFRTLPEKRKRRPAVRLGANQGNDRWGVREGGKGEPDHEVADRAIALLARLEEGPFFLAVGFDSPHPPLVAPKAHFEPYRRSKVPLPPDFAPRPELGSLASRENPALFNRRPATESDARAMIRAYRAITSFVDEQVGRVLAEVERRGLTDRTLVVFTSDHGFHLGDKGLWGKGTLFERGLHVPLVIAGPGVAAGGVSARPVQLVDLYPTLVALAGLPQPGTLDGNSMVPLLGRPDAPWPHVARSWLLRGEFIGASVRDARYRYTEWGAGGVLGRELYDHDGDPHELANLADDPAHAAAVARLSERIAERPFVR